MESAGKICNPFFTDSSEKGKWSKETVRRTHEHDANKNRVEKNPQLSSPKTVSGTDNGSARHRKLVARAKRCVGTVEEQPRGLGI